MLRRLGLYLAVMVCAAGLLVCTLLMVVPDSTVDEKPQGDGPSSAVRRWSDASGEFRIEAELEEVRDGRAHLKTISGKKISIVIDKLSAADRQYLESRQIAQAPPQDNEHTGKVASNVAPGTKPDPLPEDDSPEKPEEPSPPLRFGQQTVEQELSQPTTFEFKAMRLTEVLKALALQHRIVILVDEGNFSWGGNHPASILVESAAANGEPLEEVLRKLLEKYDMHYSVRHGVLSIISLRKSLFPSEVRVYRMHPLGKTVSLTDKIGSELMNKAKYSSKYWSSREFFGCNLPDNLLAMQDNDVGHRLMGKLLSEELTPVSCTSEELLETRMKIVSRPKEWTASEKILQQITTLDFENTPLRDAADYLSARLGIDVLIDEEALAKANLPLETRFTMQVHGIPLESGLSLMLESRGLCVQPHDLGLIITSTWAAESDGFELIYDVSDLVGKDEGRSLLEAVGKSGFRLAILRDAPSEKKPGIFGYDLARGTMSIRHSYRFHREVEKILADLRAAKKR